MIQRFTSALLCLTILLSLLTVGGLASDYAQPGENPPLPVDDTADGLHTSVLLPQSMETALPAMTEIAAKSENRDNRANCDTIFRFLTGTMGLNNAAACGVVANIHFESGFQPDIYGDNGTSYGICQWHNGRFTNLRNWCQDNGYDYTSLEGQLHFLHYELKTSYTNVWAYLNTVPNTAEGAYNAAYYWCLRFEVPADTENKSRQRGQYAKDVYWPQYGQSVLELLASTEQNAYVLGSTVQISAQATAGYDKLTLSIDRTTDAGQRELYYEDTCQTTQVTLQFHETGIYSCTFTAEYAGQSLSSNTTEFVVAEHLWDITLLEPATVNHDGQAHYVCSDCALEQTLPIAYPACGQTGRCPSARFTDLNPEAWYHEGVDFAVGNYLFSGTGLTQFCPDLTMSRAMLVTVLWRLSGAPEVVAEKNFDDVTDGAYYASAVDWAVSCGVVYGVSDTSFAPDSPVTREQMATMLYRYSQNLDYDMTDSAALTSFPDAGQTADFAVAAMQWAVAGGLVQGCETAGAVYLAPKADSTRAQVAAVCMRFANAFA